MAGLLERIANRLGYFIAPSGEEAIKIVKEQFSAISTPDPDGGGRPNWDTEVGDPGTDTWAEIYKAIPGRIDPMDISVYNDMRYGNGTVQAMIRVLQLPILATRTNVVPGPKDEGGKIAAFVTDVLEGPSYENGMEIPLHQVLFELTGSFWSGYKPAEIVWKTIKGDSEERPRIGIGKIAPRSPLTTRPVVDRHGNLVGAFQESNYMNEGKMVFIPKEKLLWYVHRMENGNWYGDSDLRTAYVHYETLRKLYIIDNKTHEVTAIPIRVAQPTMGGMTEGQKMEVFNKIRRVGLDTAILIPKDFSLTEFGARSGAGSTRQESIDHHTTQMAMSILAHFLQLGTNGQGTYNLSQDQSDMFLQMITAEMRSIADALTTQVIAPLVRINFGNKPGIVPKFVFADMTDHVRKTIESIFLAIVQGGGNRLSDEFIEALGKRVSNELGLDLSIITRVDDKTPKATMTQEEVDKIALKKFQAQANATGAMKAGPGRGNTAGGANQDQAALRKQTSPDNKGSSKANLSAAVLVETAKESDNARDFFGRLKITLSNDAGINAPSTPADITEYLDLADLSSPADIFTISQMAEELIRCAKEVDNG